jgi:hypothetical protein
MKLETILIIFAALGMGIFSGFAMRDQLYQDAIVTAFNYGRESVLVEIIDGEIEPTDFTALQMERLK